MKTMKEDKVLEEEEEISEVREGEVEQIKEGEDLNKIQDKITLIIHSQK